MVSVNSVIIKDDTGHPICHSVSAIDITQKKQLESLLVQAQKMEAIGTLAGGIAHDFNNILIAIIGNAELMKISENKTGKPAKTHLNNILHAAYRAEDLVKRILTFSRHNEIEKKPLDPSLIINETFKFLRASIPSSIDIRREIPKTTLNIMADATQMHQVLMNLCINAYHAMKPYRGLLRLALTEITLESSKTRNLAGILPPGPYVKISISDTGKGMNKKTVGRIFDPFFTTKKPDEGTGMGLSVVHGIIKNYGGAIQVNSSPGQGSLFEIFLPGVQKQPENIANNNCQPIQRGKESILLLDDEKNIVDIIEEILNQLGYKVTATTSRFHALEIFRAKPNDFDLVITDQTMPKISGTELARQLLKIRQDIPIILCSGYSEALNNLHIQNIGIRDFIRKPIGIQTMAEA